MTAGAREWRELTIPDGEPAVLVQRLHLDAVTGAVATLVRFPAGWRRPVTGYYGVEEEALFLEGSFRMSGLEYPAVTYAYFPPGYRREDSATAGGALGFASFGGRADWRRGSATTDDAAAVRITDWRTVPVGAGGGRLLHGDSGGSSSMFEDPPTGAAPVDAVMELFSLTDHSWLRLRPGAPIPEVAGPVYCRMRRVSG